MEIGFFQFSVVPVGAFKKNLQSSLNLSFSDFQSGELACTKSAFCQARQKIKVSFFSDLFDLVVKNYYPYLLLKSEHMYKNFRLWACDCSIQLLPDNESTRELGTDKYRDSAIASIKISAYFDVLSQIICKVKLFDKSKSDLFCCLEQKIEELPSDVISIYDRGYGSLLLGYLHSLYKKVCSTT